MEVLALILIIFLAGIKCGCPPSPFPIVLSGRISGEVTVIKTLRMGSTSSGNIDDDDFLAGGYTNNNGLPTPSV